MSMRDDARRYRFLRDLALSEKFKTTAPAVFMCDDDCRTHGLPIAGTRLDRQVDLAMQALETLREGGSTE